MDTQITPTVSTLDDDQTTLFDALAMRDEVLLEAIRRSNCTLIQTINSFYLFLMTDPDERRGLLVGGAVGESPTSATLLGGVRIGESHDYVTDENTGMRVVFLVEAAGRARRVVTSRVVNLAHTAVQGRTRPTTTH